MLILANYSPDKSPEAGSCERNPRSEDRADRKRLENVRDSFAFMSRLNIDEQVFRGVHMPRGVIFVSHATSRYEREGLNGVLSTIMIRVFVSLALPCWSKTAENHIGQSKMWWSIYDRRLGNFTTADLNVRVA